MPSPLSGPGVGLALPTYLYPSELQNAPYDFSNTRQTLSPGDAIVIPAGTWYISGGMYLVVQYLDPITGVWVVGASGAWGGSVRYIKSDGFNVRIANLTGCVVAAVVAAAGSGYVQASTTISVTGVSTATFVPIVGGALSPGATLTNNGAGYGVAPLLFIPSPPPGSNNPNGVGGIPASGYCTIASGTVSGISLTNPGAGYPSAPPIIILPSPFDPNINIGFTQATGVVTLTASGSITGAVCTNNGLPLNNASLANITLTVGGAGSAASLTAVVMQTMVSVTVTGAGAGYSSTVPAGIITVGGIPAAGSISNNPDALNLAWKPRPAQASIQNVNGTAVMSVGLAGTIYDGGLFEGAPTVILLSPNTGAVPTTVSTIAAVMGSRVDIAVLQPAP